MHTYEHVIHQGRVDTYLIRIDSDCKILIYLGKQRSFCLTKISNMIVYRRKTKCSLKLKCHIQLHGQLFNKWLPYLRLIKCAKQTQR